LADDNSPDNKREQTNRCQNPNRKSNRKQCLWQPEKSVNQRKDQKKTK
jgi:hypothetical protein